MIIDRSVTRITRMSPLFSFFSLFVPPSRFPLFLWIPDVFSPSSHLRGSFSLCIASPQILSKDSVTVAVDAVVYYRISNATIAVSNVEDYGRSTRLLAATTLRNVLGTKNLSEILCERETISHTMQVR